jgi:hypothetical protein
LRWKADGLANLAFRESRTWAQSRHTPKPEAVTQLPRDAWSSI